MSYSIFLIIAYRYRNPVSCHTYAILHNITLYVMRAIKIGVFCDSLLFFYHLPSDTISLLSCLSDVLNFPIIINSSRHVMITGKCDTEVMWYPFAVFIKKIL